MKYCIAIRLKHVEQSLRPSRSRNVSGDFTVNSSDGDESPMLEPFDSADFTGKDRQVPPWYYANQKDSSQLVILFQHVVPSFKEVKAVYEKLVACSQSRGDISY